MKSNIIKILASGVAFFLAYIGISYIINKQIDVIMTISMTIGYVIGYSIITIYANRKKNK